jgi:preprotein translocase subunit SecG
MIYLLVAVHVTVSIALIAVVLLQSGKGAEMGASFGASGSQSVFGAGGGNTFMSKLTTGAAVVFMLTSLTLAYISGNSGNSSIMSTNSASKVPPQKQTSPVTFPSPNQPKPVQSMPQQPVKPSQSAAPKK